MGSRPGELAAAVASIRGQTVTGPVLIVAQGVDVVAPEGAQVLRLESNMGIPGGRDAGMRTIDADVVFFLDDDARYVDASVADRVLRTMDERHDIAAVSLRIVDESGATLQRHVPRLGVRSADRSGDVVMFLGGACAIRRSAYLSVGGYFPDFFYGHEEMDLAWRMLDAGMAVRYDAIPAVIHPHTAISATDPDRWRLLARNRVWLARRRLPHPLDWIHAGIWLLIGLVRAGKAAERLTYWRGWRMAWQDPVDRRPLSWRTVLRMVRLGRPPVV